jgi:hypothetical protein
MQGLAAAADVPGFDDSKVKEAGLALKRILKFFKSNLGSKKVKNAINNIIYHVFEHHGNCQKLWCCKTEFPCASKHLDSLNVIANKLAALAPWLAENLNSNAAENFVCQYSMFLGGRRVNFSGGDAERRAYLTGLNACVGKKPLKILSSDASKIITNSGYEWHIDAMQSIELPTSQILIDFVRSIETKKEKNRCQPRNRRHAAMSTKSGYEKSTLDTNELEDLVDAKIMEMMNVSTYL